MEEYHQITINEYLSWKQEIIQRLNASVDNFIVIGYRLKQIRDTEAYRNEGYDNLGQFVQAEFNIGISTASKFMKINDVYSVNGNSMELKDEYRNFGYNKLYEMIALPIEDRQMITPETPVKDIREIRKFNEEKNAAPQKKESENSDELMEGLIRIVFEDEKMETAFNKIIHGEYQSNSDQCEILAALIPAGSRVARHKTLMVFFSGDGIRMKRIGKDDEILTFPDFYEIVEHLFQKEWSEVFQAKVTEPEKEASFDGEKEDPAADEQKESEPEESVTEEAENVIETAEDVIKKPDNVIETAESVPELPINVPENTDPVPETAEETVTECHGLEPKQQEEKTMTRYEYMQDLTEAGLASYLFHYMPTTIGTVKDMKKWLHQTVDEKGGEWNE